MFRREFYRLGGMLGTRMRLHKGLLLWLGIFIVIGIIIGASTVSSPKVGVSQIPSHLIDANIVRVVRLTGGFGSMLWARIFGFALFFACAFVVCLNKWTSWLVFPLIAFQGFTLVINMYWILTRFGIATAVPLFIFYLLIMLALLVLEICAVIYLLHLRGRIRGNNVARPCFMFLCSIAVFALVEWVLYWLILARLVFGHSSV